MRWRARVPAWQRRRAGAAPVRRLPGSTRWIVGDSSALETCGYNSNFGNPYLKLANNDQAGDGPPTAPAYMTGPNRCNGETGWIDFEPAPRAPQAAASRSTTAAAIATQSAPKATCELT